MGEARPRELASEGTEESFLHDDDVEPGAELAADLALDADLPNPALLVQPDGASCPPTIRAMAVWNPCGAARRRSSEQERSHASTTLVRPHVDRALDGGVVRRPLPERRQGGEADDLVLVLGDEHDMGARSGLQPGDLLVERAGTRSKVTVEVETSRL
jgi:hypothetical protein